MYCVQSYIFFDFEIRLCYKNEWNIEFSEKTIGFNFWLDSISDIISSNTINTVLFFVGLIFF